VKFLKSLWNKVSPIYQQIINHPFNVELASGILSQERFTFYMQQDAYYLIEFSKALALIAGRSRSAKTVHHFLDFSLKALIAERSLHSHFLKQVNEDACDIEPSLACIAYTKYLIATASTASIEETVAAVLPCFWVYREVGMHIKKTTQQNNPYALWINTYSSEEFSRGVNLACSIFDDMASQSSPSLISLMSEAFEYSTLLEWHFWNDAYQTSIFRNSYLPNVKENAFT